MLHELCKLVLGVWLANHLPTLNNPSMTGQSATDPLKRRIGTEDWAEETIGIAEEEISRLVSHFDEDEMVEQLAIALYRRGIKTRLIENTNIGTLTAVSVYASCRIENSPVNQWEVVSESNCNNREFNRVYSGLIDELEVTVGPVDPKKYVARYCDDLGLSKIVEAKTEQIIELSRKKTREETGGDLLSGKSPSGFAAASVYAASLLCNEKKTQFEVANVASVSPSTIRNRYQEQIEAIGIHRSDNPG